MHLTGCKEAPPIPLAPSARRCCCQYRWGPCRLMRTQRFWPDTTHCSLTHGRPSECSLCMFPIAWIAPSLFWLQSLGACCWSRLKGKTRKGKGERIRQRNKKNEKDERAGYRRQCAGLPLPACRSLAHHGRRQVTASHHCWCQL